MPLPNDDYLNAAYDRDEQELVIANGDEAFTAYNVTVRTDGHPIHQDPACGLSSEPEGKITLDPGEEYRIPFKRTQKGPSENRMIEVVYYDEGGDQCRQHEEVPLT